MIYQPFLVNWDILGKIVMSVVNTEKKYQIYISSKTSRD